MNYELAKQLKDTGFPYEWCNEFPKHCDEGCFPTLSELIEAVGFPIDLGSYVKGHWYARNGYHSKAVSLEGSTPEEAVSMLYLKLHERKT